MSIFIQGKCKTFVNKSILGEIDRYTMFMDRKTEHQKDTNSP